MKITGIVLAGGRSARFGTNKAIYDFQGKTMLKHSVDLLRPFCSEIMISGDKAEYQRYDAPCIPDKYGEVGPLGGIASCLEKAQQEVSVVVTCDMPLVTEELLNKLINHHEIGKITVFTDSKGMIFPFPLIIEHGHLKSLMEHLMNNSLRLTDIMKDTGCTTVLLDEEQIGYLANVNSHDDLIIAENQINAK